ncbi:Panacea domain-containing protein [Geodermatophilus sp. DSM 45219]|uniref:Panacea domain-containing protein n=1 Tax=Geodermatophilus sp. DSM 45219 TaxID=1881103 RepID=UPI000890CA5D|nr:type II toxin-antitoxin system antitoxin SocA domain-containing protein [Geodermatophilus sp. DSM 45219]SDO37837.1 Uncharacterized phage-associated protein [Geodermatophilus sp. DSM 45219]
MGASTARDVAGYILDRLGPMESWKVQKLTYYTQAWALAWEGQPVFDDRIEAWTNGPVTPSIWNAHRKQRWVTRLPGAHPDRLTPEQVDVVEAVLDFYGSCDGDTLSKMTHDEGPWQEARRGLSEGAWSDAEISQRSMRGFYTRATLTGAPVPTRRPSMHTADPEQTIQHAQSEIERWHHTLDWLAVR